jgi:phosphopantetheinyl transferase
MDCRLPFLGDILEYEAGKRITVSRLLTVTEDLYLQDHLFVNARLVKPPEECMPVLPLSFSLEALAEVGACLVPGCGLTGFERVKTPRWTCVDAAEKSLKLKIEATRDADAERCIVHAVGFVDNPAAPLMSADVILGAEYVPTMDLQFAIVAPREAYPRSVRQVYEERHLFHGPAFQCLRDEIACEGPELTGVLEVLPTNRLFHSIVNPELLTDPVVLDGVGQLFGLWAQAQGKFIFPVGIDKLEINKPTPPVGTRVPVRLRVVRSDARLFGANMEVGDGNGGVWMRIEGWTDWVFKWSSRGFDFRRSPNKCQMTRPLAVAGLSPAPACQLILRDDLTDFGLEMALGYYVNSGEASELKKHSQTEERLWPWLLGRIAAKESVRAWLKQKTGDDEMPHPASFPISTRADGSPAVQADPQGNPVPNISISHSGDRAVAAASDLPVGIDIEKIRDWDDATVSGITVDSERRWLEGCPAADRSRRITSLWCAKEAVGKCLKIGIARTLHAARITGTGPDETLLLEIADLKATFVVWTHEQDGYIIACTCRRADLAAFNAPAEPGVGTDRVIK